MPEMLPVTDWAEAVNDKPRNKTNINDNLKLTSVTQDIEGLLRVIALMIG